MIEIKMGDKYLPITFHMSPNQLSVFLTALHAENAVSITIEIAPKSKETSCAPDPIEYDLALAALETERD